MPSCVGYFVQIIDEPWNILYYFSLPSVGDTSNFGDCSIVFALGNMGCKLNHCALTFAHYNVIYLRMLQHTFRHVRGMPSPYHYFAGWKRLLDGSSCL